MRKLLVLATAMLGALTSGGTAGADEDGWRGRGRAIGQIRRAPQVEVVQSPRWHGTEMEGLWYVVADGRPALRLQVWQSAGGRWHARTLAGDDMDRVFIDPRTGRFDFNELSAFGWQSYRGEVRGNRIFGQFSYFQEGPYHDPRALALSGAIQPFGRDRNDDWRERRYRTWRDD